MAGFVPYEWKALVLEATAGRTSISSSTLYLGLAQAINDEDPQNVTLATIMEPTTAGYSRKQVPVFDPASTVPPIQILVSSAFSFNQFTADMDGTVIYAFLTNAASGTSGRIHYVWELTEPMTVQAGDSPSVAAGELIIE